jgi:hypothetical protein
MKRALAFALAIFGLTLGALMASLPAQAAVVTCQQAVTNSAGYPYHQWTQYCIGTTQANHGDRRSQHAWLSHV